MGIYLCETHGEQGFYEMCSHVHVNLKRGDYNNVNVTNIFEVLLCKQCCKSLNASAIPKMDFDTYLELPDTEAKPVERVLMAVYDNIPGRICMCRKCVDEVKNTKPV